MKKVFCLLLTVVIGLTITGCMPQETTIEKIEIYSMPEKTTYREEEDSVIDIKGLDILITMSDGSTEIENVKEQNAKEPGTYTIEPEINYDKAGDYYVMVKRKGCDRYCVFKVSVIEVEKKYSDELNANDFQYNAVYLRPMHILKGNKLYTNDLYDKVSVFDLDTKETKEIKITLNEKYENYFIFDFFEADKFNFVTVYREDVESGFEGEGEYEYKYLIYDKEMNFVKEIEYEYKGSRIFSVHELFYNGEVYFNIFLENGEAHFLKFNQDSNELELIIKEEAEFIIRDNIIYIKDNCFYRYNMNNKTINLVAKGLSDYPIYHVKGDFIYLKRDDGYYRISYDGKVENEFKTLEDEAFFFIGDETFYFYIDLFYDEIKLCYYDKDGNFINLLSENKNLDTDFGIYSNGEKHYYAFYDGDYLYFLEFDEASDLLSYDGDKTKLIKTDGKTVGNFYYCPL